VTESQRARKSVVAESRFGWPEGVQGAAPCHILVRDERAHGRQTLYRAACGAQPVRGFREVTEQAPTADRICGDCRQHLRTRHEPRHKERRMGRAPSEATRTEAGYCAFCRDIRSVESRPDRAWGQCTVCGATISVRRHDIDSVKPRDIPANPRCADCKSDDPRGSPPMHHPHHPGTRCGVIERGGDRCPCRSERVLRLTE
jgi:hypothetical protein